MHKIILLLTISTTLIAQTWQELLTREYAPLLQNPSCQLIEAQYIKFQEGHSPAVAWDCIKSINIIECGEPLINIREIGNPRISMMPDPVMPFEDAIYNSGMPGASFVRASLFEHLVRMVHYLDTLAPVFGYKSGQIDIKVFEGLRDLQTQQKLFDNKKSEIQQMHPEMSEEELFAETSKWVSPVRNNIPVHSTGAAVDIRLWDNENNTFVDMGKFGVLWGSNPNCVTFAQEITDEQKKNRLFCLLAAAHAKLTNYAYEYWHFSYGDRYAAYWNWLSKDNPIAQYGSISQLFNR